MSTPYFKPCPFCGQPANVDTEPAIYLSQITVRCIPCGVEMSAHDVVNEVPMAAGLLSARWNTRTAPFHAEQPISNVRWVHRDELSSNLYNPNRMAPPEMDLLVRSLKEDGWLFPICVLPKGVQVAGLTAENTNQHTIIDGFHRYTISGRTEVYGITDGYVPIVMPAGSDFIATTVRMNRIKGTHTVLGMADIVQYLLQNGRSVDYIMAEYGMEEEEVVRLANRKGIPQTDLIRDTEFSASWTPGKLK